MTHRPVHWLYSAAAPAEAFDEMCYLKSYALQTTENDMCSLQPQYAGQNLRTDKKSVYHGVPDVDEIHQFCALCKEEC